MPALCTYHAFGRKAARLGDAHIIAHDECRHAFLLGVQGGAPLHLRFIGRPRSVQACRDFAEHLASEEASHLIAELFGAVPFLPADDQAIGRAFCAGMAAHLTLASRLQPFIDAQIRDLIAVDSELTEKSDEVRALIEAEIDTWAWQVFCEDVPQEMTPEVLLARSSRLEQAAGALLSQVAYSEYHLPLSGRSYGHALHDVELVLQAATPAGGVVPMALRAAETVITGHSMLALRAHTPQKAPHDSAINLAHYPWKHPVTGEISRASVGDLFAEALEAWNGVAEALASDTPCALVQALAEATSCTNKGN